MPHLSPPRPLTITVLQHLKHTAQQRRVYIGQILCQGPLLHALSREEIIAGAPLTDTDRPVLFRYHKQPVQVPGSTMVTLHQHDPRCRGRLPERMVCFNPAAEHIATLTLLDGEVVTVAVRAVESNYLYTEEEGILVSFDGHLYNGHRESVGLLSASDQLIIQAVRKSDLKLPFHRSFVLQDFATTHSGYATRYLINSDDHQCSGITVVGPDGKIILGHNHRHLHEVRTEMKRLLKETNLPQFFAAEAHST